MDIHTSATTWKMFNIWRYNLNVSGTENIVNVGLKAKEWLKCKLRCKSCPSCSPEEGGVDFRELGTTSPKLEDELAPNLLEKETKWVWDSYQRSPDKITGDEWFCCRYFFLPGVEFSLFGSLLLEDASVFYLHRTGNETDFTAFFHQASYPPVVVKFLCKEIRYFLFRISILFFLKHQLHFFRISIQQLYKITL